MLKHGDIWRAIDLLAARHNLSPSGLARKAGLSPTVFNVSKRASSERKRWPSTESLARILEATGTSINEFIGLIGVTPSIYVPLLDVVQAASPNAFDDAGHPAGTAWRNVRFPGVTDPHAFALEVVGRDWEPLYRVGEQLILSLSSKARQGDRVLVRLRGGAMRPGDYVREDAQNLEIVAMKTSDNICVSLTDIEWVGRILWVGAL